MGLTNEPRQGASNFVNFKDGKLINTNEAGEKLEFTNLSGFITDLEITDEEYNTKKYRKITLFITEGAGEPVLKLGFPLESGYGNCFSRIAPNIDFRQAVNISGGSETMDSGNKYGKLFVKQGGTNLKWYYSSKADDSVPQPEDITYKGKITGKDYSAQNDFFFDLLFNKIRPKIKAGATLMLKGHTPAPDPKTKTKKDTGKVLDTSEGEGFAPKDDLPF